MSRRREWVIITLILLLAAALRFWMLGQVPPGLSNDEVLNSLIARDILAGHHAVYFTVGYGRESLYHYVLAATMALFGDHWLGLRYPSVAFGLLGLATTYVLVRRLFGSPSALLTASWLAVSFWPLFYARVAWRAISLPFIAALAAYFLLRATNPQAPKKGHEFKDSLFVPWLLAGLFLGLSLYTYMSARILPAIFVSFLIYYLFLTYSSTHIPWSRLILFLLTAALVCAPLVAWLTAHPEAEYRISEVREPLDRLLAGDPSLVRQNFVANLKLFTFSGDPWAHQNLRSRPVFADPVSAALFYAGLLIALWRWRTPKYGLLLIWLLGALVPSIVTAVAPSSVRDILGLVVVFVFPALALVEAGCWIERFLPSAFRLPRPARILPLASCVLLLAPCFFLTARDYFVRWPLDDVARFFFQADLTAVGRRLDELPSKTPVVVAGLTVHSTDGPTLNVVARRDIADVRLCDTRETLVVPTGRDVWLFVPQVVPFDADLRERLLRWGAMAEVDWQSSFTGYHLSDDAALRRDLQDLMNAVALPDHAPVTLPASFGGRLSFLGYEWLGQAPTPGTVLAVLTYWRVEEPPPTPLRTFVHLIGESEIPLAQHDSLGSPPHGWAPGDLIVQKHAISLPADLPLHQYHLQLGVYDPATGIRLPVLSADRLLLYSFEVTE
jgi:hypothetical protein